MVVVCESVSGPQTVPSVRLGLLPLAGGELRPLAADWDRWPPRRLAARRFGPAGRPPTRTARAGVPHRTPRRGAVRRLTHDAAAYTDVVVARTGGSSTRCAAPTMFPPEPVRIDLARRGHRRCCAGAAARLRGRLDEIRRRCGRRHRSRARLAGAARGASAPNPAPLLLWIHGGPLGSWNAWTLALEPVAAGGAGLRRAAAGPGPVHRLRPGLHPARLGRSGARLRSPT